MAAYTNINDPSVYFQSILYAGDDDNSTVITNTGNSDLQADFIWIKSRTHGNSGTGSHMWFDSSRGIKSTTGSNSPYLSSNSTNEDATNNNGLQAIGSDTFTPGSMTRTNESGDNYVAWQWKGNGGTTSTNTAGSIDTTVQVNANAGFSIVTFTSPGSGVYSMGHGLGVTPSMIIFKNREATSQWFTWHKDLTNLVTGRLSLERTDNTEFGTASWGAGVTSTLFGLSVGMLTVANNDYVAYCFAEKQGYSKMSKYVGNGNADGPFVYTGFKPAWIMCKNATTTGDNWEIRDNKRNDFNPQGKALYANLHVAEYNATAIATDSLSNGFKVRATDHGLNEIGETYIYMAFAENPFTTSTGIPTTAR